MISVWRQYWLLLWKGYIIKSRQKLWIILEITIPISLFALLVIIRTRNFDVLSSTCHYNSKPFPSAGLLPFSHSLLCTLSNNCGSDSTDDSDTYFVNKPSTRESILIKFTRWLVDVFVTIGENPVGWRDVFDQIGHLIHSIASLDHRHVMSHDDRLILPFSVLFDDRKDMISKLTDYAGLDPKRAEKFDNISITPLFFINAGRELEAWQRGDNNASALDLLFGRPIELFCNETLRRESFTSPGNETEEVDLCSITTADIAPLLLMSEQGMRPGALMPKLTRYFLARGGIKDEDGIAALQTIIFKLPPFDFGPFFGDQKELLNAVFCGSFMDSIIHSKGESSAKSAGGELLAELQAKVQEFVMKLTPGQSHDEHGVVMCEDVPVRESATNSCSALGILTNGPIAGIKVVLNGYVLVTPDSPVTRDLVDRLSAPLRKAKYFRDLVEDFTLIADSLQDAIADSDLGKAADILAELIPSSAGNGTYHWALEHLFKNSSDPEALLVQAKVLAERFLETSECFRFDRFVFVANESTLEKTAMCLSNYDLYWSGIVFPDNVTDMDTIADYTEYKIRHLHSLVDGTSRVMDHPGHYISRDDPFGDLKYLTYGFSYLQEAIEHAIIEMYTNKSIPSGLIAQQEPYPCVQMDIFNVTTFLSLFLILSWMIPSALLVKNIVWEKEMRLKEMMRIMGMGDMIHWVAWATQNFAFNMVSIALISCLLKYGNILPSVDISLLVVFLICFAVACLAQCLFLTTIFSHANVATACTSLLFFLFFVPFQLSVRMRSPVVTLITLILPQTCVGYGMTMIALSEAAGEAHWSTMDDIYLDAYKIGLAKVFIAFFVDTVFYFFLAWYISAVFPGTYGIPRPWNFCFTSDYWFSSPPNVEVIESASTRSTTFTGGTCEDVERDPDFPLAVEIQDLDKVYDNGTKALDGLSVRFFEGQITAFLGHNGAGKSTTISILSGLYPPTRGTALVYGRDIRSDMRAIRDSLGVCPQHNVFFVDMTVEQQLTFFAALKGVPTEDIDAEVDLIVRDIGLAKKRKALTNDLSGGMKRKLCIGIALIGGSRLVILDEPTAGIDAHARRSVWKLLLKHKKNRTMILSTHHMDEADVLADRIAIISEGQLRCAGSSLFLKKRFGDGYHLTIARPPTNVLPSLTSTDTSSPENKPSLPSLIATATSDRAVLIDESSSELVYVLPLDLPAHDMQRIFEALETLKEKNEIGAFGVSAPSLQQIFIKVAPAHELILKKFKGRTICSVAEAFVAKIKHWTSRVAADDGTMTPPTDDSTQESDQLVEGGAALEKDHAHPVVSYETEKIGKLKQHARALFAKKWQNTKRSKMQLFCLLLCPILLLLLSEIYSNIQNSIRSLSYMASELPLYMTPVIYGNSTQLYVGAWYRNATTQPFMEALVHSPGPGVRCVPDLEIFDDIFDRCQWGTATGIIDFDADNSSTIYDVPNTCGCTANSGWNCSACSYPVDELDWAIANTSDILWDVSYRNLSQYRLMTSVNTTKLRNVVLGGVVGGHINIQKLTPVKLNEAYDGLIVIEESSKSLSALWGLDWKNATADVNWTTQSDPFVKPADLTPNAFFRSTVAGLDTHDNTKVWFNNKAWASLPINTNTYHNAIFRALRPSDVSADLLGIMAISHPMNETVRSAISDSQQLQKTIAFRVVVMVLVFSFLPAAVCLSLVEERTSFSRHLQSVFGVAPWMYWITSYIFDYAVMMVCSLIVIFMYTVIGVSVFSYRWNAFITSILLFATYNACALPLVYLLQYAFRIPAVAYACIGIGEFFIGVVTSMTILLLENLTSNDDTLIIAHRICSIIFLVLPQYNMGMAIARLNFVHGIYVMAERYLESINRSDSIGDIPLPDVGEFELVGRHIIALIILTVLFIIGLLAFEYRKMILKFSQKYEKTVTRKLVKKNGGLHKTLDEDVVKEQEFVNQLTETDDFGLVVKNLSKAYKGEFLAVNNLSFAARKGDCFGLLGVNGAGKTTTFSMLTGRLSMGYGDAFVHGHSIREEGLAGLCLIGYCPQFDALNLRLTAREQLAFYARLRCILEPDVGRTVEWAVAEMQLRTYANEVSGSYSGGNKRKLSAAIALVADPPVVLLDEPSAGMDVVSQQFMWNLIRALRRSHRTVVITSHSMEECEALCTRTGIMVDGQFSCLGSIQHLKTRFGHGYTLTLKLNSPEDITTAKDFIATNIPGAHLKSIHCNSMFYRISSVHCTLSTAFGAISQLQDIVTVQDYTLSQTTLDDVFVTFAAGAGDELESTSSSDNPSHPLALPPPPQHPPVYPDNRVTQIASSDASTPGDAANNSRPLTHSSSSTLPPALPHPPPPTGPPPEYSDRF